MPPEQSTTFRVGVGYDVHRLVPERALILGGVTIPFDRGLAGHSDADVLVHAICDALLGAVALGDLGHHFPDTDPQWEGADSLQLLETVGERVRDEGYRVTNIDSSLILEQPKLQPYIEQMCANVARAAAIPPAAVSVKATTSEQLGFIGREEGIAAHAICAVSSIGHRA